MQQVASSQKMQEKSPGAAGQPRHVAAGWGRAHQVPSAKARHSVDGSEGITQT